MRENIFGKTWRWDWLQAWLDLEVLMMQLRLFISWHFLSQCFVHSKSDTLQGYWQLLAYIILHRRLCQGKEPAAITSPVSTQFLGRSEWSRQGYGIDNSTKWGVGWGLAILKWKKSGRQNQFQISAKIEPFAFSPWKRNTCQYLRLKFCSFDLGQVS